MSKYILTAEELRILWRLCSDEIGRLRERFYHTKSPKGKMDIEMQTAQFENIINKLKKEATDLVKEKSTEPPHASLSYDLDAIRFATESATWKKAVGCMPVVK